jgi:surfactin synthase thioesterase subunit
MPTAGRWLLRPPPDTARTLLFGFPYAGGGASLYRQWPERVGNAWVCPLQPPGREHRFTEPPLWTVPAFATELADYLARFADRRYAFFGHCGGVPLALAATLAVQDRGLPLPTRVFASGWGAPHTGLYGRLNFIDLDTADLRAEVGGLFARLGVAVRDDLVDVAADILRTDLVMHRPHRYDAARRLPVPVTVIGWSDDDLVPAALACTGWEPVADTRYQVLTGEHFAFTCCPPALARLIAREMAAVAAGPVPPTTEETIP